MFCSREPSWCHPAPTARARSELLLFIAMKAPHGAATRSSRAGPQCLGIIWLTPVAIVGLPSVAGGLGGFQTAGEAIATV